MAQKEFRKPPRYMVGDIVYSHGFICIVCSIYPFNIDYSYDLKVIDGQGLGKICQNDIMHVHIWEEFLKKNGWTCYRSEGECFGHRWYKHQEYPFTLRYNNFLGIIGVSFNDGKDDTVMIKCVDENGEHIFCEEPLRGRTQKYVSFYREQLIRQQSSKLWYANADDIDDGDFIIYAEEGIDLPKGSIKKLIGRELSWSDEPVELK